MREDALVAPAERAAYQQLVRQAFSGDRLLPALRRSMPGAERWGLDAMWLGELHFYPGRSVLSAPLCIASAIAMRTRRMKIGLAVQVLPLCHPLRLAEEAATVDQISNGRLIFGVGRSGVAISSANTI